MTLFHRHKWTDWTIADRGTVAYLGRTVGWYLVQHRHCMTCGKTDVSDQAEYAGAYRDLCLRRSEHVRQPKRDGVKA